MDSIVVEHPTRTWNPCLASIDSTYSFTLQQALRLEVGLGKRVGERERETLLTG